jgi:hypothetical protein
MSPNSCGSTSRPFAWIDSVIEGLPTDGSSPSEPSDDWSFWSLIAAYTSIGVSPSCDRRSGSSQTRMAYCCRPKTVVLPTPSTRATTGSTVMLA